MVQWRPDTVGVADSIVEEKMKDASQGIARFAVGQVIRHCLFDYYGVICDVDPCFMGTEEWYREVARSCPPKDSPWYHVLVDGNELETYVAERNMEGTDKFREIHHPFVAHYFLGHDNRQYLTRRVMS